MEFGNNKPFFILLQGPSVSCLKNTDCHQFDVNWLAINKLNPMRDLIKKDIDFFYCSSLERFRQAKRDLIENPEVRLITSSALYYNVPWLRERMTYVTDLGNGFSSLFACLVFLMKMGVSDIVLFGADGGRVDGGNVYFDLTPYKGENFKQREKTIRRDTRMMNRIFWDVVEYLDIKRKRVRLFDPKNVSLLNCFEKVSSL